MTWSSARTRRAATFRTPPRRANSARRSEARWSRFYRCSKGAKGSAFITSDSQANLPIGCLLKARRRRLVSARAAEELFRCFRLCWFLGLKAPQTARIAVAEMVMCDAQVIDASEPTHVGRRAQTTIPRAIRRLLMLRENGRCIGPGCKNATFAQAHHLTARADGGRHDRGPADYRGTAIDRARVQARGRNALRRSAQSSGLLAKRCCALRSGCWRRKGGVGLVSATRRAGPSLEVRDPVRAESACARRCT